MRGAAYNWPMLVVLDESGDTGLGQSPGSSDYFGVCAVAFAELAHARLCDAWINALRRQIGKKSGFEFHFALISPDGLLPKNRSRWYESL